MVSKDLVDALDVLYPGLQTLRGNALALPQAVEPVTLILATDDGPEERFALKRFVAGAVSGALVNLAFMQHFQDIARAHFIVRRLERSYGEDEVRRRYGELAASG